MSISKGTPLVVLSSKNMADGDPVQRARIAYETAKKEYERMKELLPNKIVSEKTSPKPGRPMRMPASAMKPLPKTIRHRVRPSPLLSVDT